MTLKLSENELERLLRGAPGQNLRPPEGLLARLRADLPAELPHELPPDSPPDLPAPGNLLRHPRWSSRSLLSLAATLAVVAAGSFLALRTLRENPGPGLTVSDSARRDPEALAAPQAAAVPEALPELKKESAKPAVAPAEAPPAKVLDLAPPPPPPPLARRSSPAPAAAPEPATAASEAAEAESSLGVGGERFELQRKAPGAPPAEAAEPAHAGTVPGGIPGGVPGGTVAGTAGGSATGEGISRNSYDRIAMAPLEELDGRRLEAPLAEAAAGDEQRRADDAPAGKADPADQANKAKVEMVAQLQAGSPARTYSSSETPSGKDQPIDLRDAEGRRRARQLESPTVQGDAHGPPPPAAAAPREPRSSAASDANAAAWEAIESSLAAGIWPSFELLDAARLPPGGAGKKTAGRDADSGADVVLKLREECLDFFGKMEKNRGDLTPLRRRAIRLYTLRPNDPRLAELVRMLNLASHLLPD